MNLLNLPVFILFFAIVYLSIVYGLLKMAQAQKTDSIIGSNANDTNQKIETNGDSRLRSFRAE